MESLQMCRVQVKKLQLGDLSLLEQSSRGAEGSTIV